MESRDNVLCRRLQQSHNIGDKLVLALESGQLIEFVSTYEDALLGVSSLQCRDTLLRVVLQQLGWRVGNFREKDSRIASKCRIETFVINL